MLLWTQGSLLNQLAIANESMGGGIVVVMAERDKEEMELDIAKMEFDFRETSVICRSGSPLILADLKKVQRHSSSFLYHTSYNKFFHKYIILNRESKGWFCFR